MGKNDASIVVLVAVVAIAVIVVGVGTSKIFSSFSETGNAETSASTGNAVKEKTTENAASAESEAEGNVREINLKAYRFGFDPSSITVNKGDRVKLTAESIDVPHGVSIAGYGVNLYLDGRSKQTAEFVADKSGEFTIYCSVPCGSGHGSMRGTLIVK